MLRDVEIPHGDIAAEFREEEAFLRAMLDAPDSDDPTLIYADWLEERGRVERAELIRVQVRLAAFPGPPWDALDTPEATELRKREAKLRARHRREPLETLPELGGGVCWDGHERGMVRGATANSPADFLAVADEVFRFAPVDRLTLLSANREGMAALARSTAFARIRRLQLADLDLEPKDLAPVVAAAVPGRLREWELRSNPALGPGFRAGGPLAAISATRALGLHRCRIDDDALRDMIEGGAIGGGLERLDLSANPLGYASARRLRDAIVEGGVGGIRLNLESTWIGDAGAREFLDPDCVRLLRCLNLRKVDLARDTAAELKRTYGARIVC